MDGAVSSGAQKRSMRELLIVAAAAGVTAIPVILGARSAIQPGIDLEVYLAAGQAVLEGQNPYGEGFGGGLSTKLPFTYPPVAALLAVPLSLLPFWFTYVLWTVATVIAVSWLSIRSKVFGENLSLAKAIALGVWTAYLYPVSDSLALGQISGLLVPAVYFSAVAAIELQGRAIWVGVFTAIKLTPGLFLVWFAFIPKRRALIGGLSAFVALTLIGFLAFPQQSIDFFSSLLFDADRVGDPSFNLNQSLNGLMQRAGLPHWTWLVSAAVFGVMGLVRGTQLARRGRIAAAVSLIGLTTVLVSPISWPHHAIWVIPAIGVCVSSSKTLVQAVGWASAVLLLLRLPLWGEYMPMPWIAFIVENAFVGIYIALFAALQTTGPQEATKPPQDSTTKPIATDV
jgi:alpha-1,2-mannosyltransferase